MFTKLALSCCAIIASYCSISAQTTSKVTTEDIRSGKYSVDLEKLKAEQAISHALIAKSQAKTCANSNITPEQQSQKLAVAIADVKDILANLKGNEKEDIDTVAKYEQTLETLKTQKATIDNQLSKK